MVRTTSDVDRRREILDTTEMLIGRKGFRRTTIRDIAKNMNVAQGMLYYYFESKEKLLSAVVQRQLLTVINKTQGDANFIRGTPTEKISIMLSAMISGAYSQELFLLHKLFEEKDMHIQEQVNQQVDSSISECLELIIEEGIKDGFFRVENPGVILDFLLKFFEVLIAAVYSRDSKQQLVHYLQVTENLLEALLGVEAEKLYLTR